MPAAKSDTGTKPAASHGVERRIKASNVAGSGARAMARERRSIRRWLGFSSLLSLALLLCANLMNLQTRSVWIVLMCIAGLVLIGRGIVPILDLFQKRENDADRGAEAEEAVAAILDRLPDNYMVLHDVPSAYGNIDHVVLRKDGAIFVIETKSTAGSVSQRHGKLLVNGRACEKDFVNQTLRNTFWVRDLIASEVGAMPWVSAALIFTRARVAVCEMKNVRVMNACSLGQWMARTPAKPEVARRAAPKWEKLRTALARTQ